MKPFLIDAVVGNGRLLGCFTADGQLQRAFWPHVDGGQQIERFLLGLSVDAGPVVWQDQWRSVSQAYEADQNVLVTRSSVLDLAVTAQDFALVDRDVLVRHLRFTNEGSAPMDLRVAAFQWVRVDENPLYNTALYDDGLLVGFRREVYVGLGASRPLSRVHIGYPEETLRAASRLAFRVSGKAVLPGEVAMHGDVAGAGLYELGSVAPGESVELTLYLGFARTLAEVRSLVTGAAARGLAALLASVRDHWTSFLASARQLVDAPASVDALYKRSLLTFKLMADEQTGGVIAAPEFDPGFTKCGGYAYVWGRDAAFITTAMDHAGLHEMAAAFYRWAIRVQEPEGWWAHRHQVTGEWAPSWGLLQVDETGSLLYGMKEHARLHGGAAFASEVWPSVAKAADWLISGLDPVLGLPVASVDLWEERTAHHTYSSAAVYAGLVAASELADMAGVDGAAYASAAERLRASILKETVRDGRFLRGRSLLLREAEVTDAIAAGGRVTERPGVLDQYVYVLDEDPVPDASLLGVSVPFGVVSVDDPLMTATAAWLEDSLWTPPAGGLMRYAGDIYAGGNPWVLTTLWLGQYEAACGNTARALELLEWATARQNRVGLLPEQVSHLNGEPVWVVPLTWSHAMYVLLALQLYGS